MHSRIGLGPFSSTSTVLSRSASVTVVRYSPPGPHLEHLRERRIDRAIPAGPVQLVRAAVRDDHGVEPLAEDRHREPLVHGEDEVPEGLDERPLPVDRLVQLLLGQGAGTVDRGRPDLLELRPRRAHAARVRCAQHRPQRIPGIVFVHVRGHVDAVDHDRVDQSVDVDVGQPGSLDARVGQVDVAEERPTEVHAPEGRARQIPVFERLGHDDRSFHRTAAHTLLDPHAYPGIAESARPRRPDRGGLGTVGQGRRAAHTASVRSTQRGRARWC
jgi:hypothetical protein